MLNKVKLLLNLVGDSSKDRILTLLIEMAQEFTKNYIHSINISGLESTIIEMVVYRYSRIGSEGLSSEDYSGVSFDYSDLPDSIYKQLNKHRKIGVL